MKQFYVPQYVKDILSRSQFAVDSGRFMDDDDPGYTILVHKRTARTMVYTLQVECERLEKWARRTWPDLDWENLPVVRIRRVPTRTHNYDQYARVDIYDPVMQRIEGLIPGRNSIRFFK
jgi:hypothetical protein